MVLASVNILSVHKFNTCQIAKVAEVSSDAEVAVMGYHGQCLFQETLLGTSERRVRRESGDNIKTSRLDFRDINNSGRIGPSRARMSMFSHRSRRPRPSHRHKSERCREQKHSPQSIVKRGERVTAKARIRHVIIRKVSRARACYAAADRRSSSSPNSARTHVICA
jgi:hypothetical protein